MKKNAMVHQIKRAVPSVHLNIAEGWLRKSQAERKNIFWDREGTGYWNR